MLDILKRIYNIARSNTLHYTEVIKNKVLGKDSYNYSDNFHFDADAKTTQDHSTRQYQQEFSKNDIPRQVIEDLKVFNLSPPSSLEEVKKARNREIKKFHSDKFQNDPDKLETSKQIMQIYNAAYARLEEYYLKKRKT